MQHDWLFARARAGCSPKQLRHASQRLPPREPALLAHVCTAAPPQPLPGGPCSQACVSFVAASKERFAQLLATPGYLHLTAASPKVGQLFLSQAMAQLLGRE